MLFYALKRRKTMKTVKVTVKNKVAAPAEDVTLVGGNADVRFSFEFDGEWSEKSTKTAVFVTSDGSAFYETIENGECAMPVLYNTSYVKVGVLSADIMTSTAAVIPCRLSIDDEAASGRTVGSDAYRQLLALIDKRMPAEGYTKDEVYNKSEVYTKKEVYSKSETYGKSEVYSKQQTDSLLESYCRKDEACTKDDIDALENIYARRRVTVTSAVGVVALNDKTDISAENVQAVNFVCGKNVVSNVFLTLASSGDVSIAFTGLSGYYGDDYAAAKNGEVWEFDIKHGYCFGRRWKA